MTFCLRQPQYVRFFLVNAVSEAFASEAVGAAEASFPFPQVALTFECPVDWLDVWTFLSQFIDTQVNPRLGPSCSLCILCAMQNTVLHVFQLLKPLCLPVTHRNEVAAMWPRVCVDLWGPSHVPPPSSLYSWSRAALNRLKLCFCLRWGNFPEPTLLSCPYIQGTAEGVVPATRNQYVCQSPGDGAPAALLIHRVLWGAAPQPSGLQWTLHVSSALLKVWGERVDRLGKASSVTRPGPLQCAPTPAFPGARPTHRSCITTTSSLSGKSCTQP